MQISWYTFYDTILIRMDEVSWHWRHSMNRVSNLLFYRTQILLKKNNKQFLFVWTRTCFIKQQELLFIPENSLAVHTNVITIKKTIYFKQKNRISLDGAWRIALTCLKLSVLHIILSPQRKPFWSLIKAIESICDRMYWFVFHLEMGIESDGKRFSWTHLRL